VGILVGTFLPLNSLLTWIVSDTASGDASTDRSGPALKALFAEPSDTWTVAHLKIVPDDVEAIQSQVKKWTDEEMLNLVVTTGGTGFAIRDITPEVPSSPPLN
jgi:gephyrin